MVREWEAKRPETPGLLDTVRGAIVGIRVSDELKAEGGLSNDKWKHCVVGAEIALATSYETARFAAWIKEYEDLTDGKADTSFDEDDYKATLDGARQAAQEQACEGCFDLCEERWGARDRPWDGESPSEGAAADEAVKGGL